MPDELSLDEKTIVDEALRRLRANDRQPIPSTKVKQFLQMIGDELKRTGELKKAYVEGLVQQLRSGEL
jgi:hypothetical protein